jgi:hypothetical protein
VLDGELAVPCYPQPAPVGSNSLPRPGSFWPVSLQVAMRAGALRLRGVPSTSTKLSCAIRRTLWMPLEREATRVSVS